MTLRRGGLALGAVALVAAVATGSSVLGVVGVGFVLAAGVTSLWAVLVDGPVHVSQTVTPLPAIEGDRVRLELETRRASRFPLGSMVVRVTAGRLGLKECRIGHGRVARGAIDLGRLPRGVFSVASTEVVLGDLLGLTSVRPRVVGDSAAIVVRPRLTALTSLFCDTGWAVGDRRRVLLRRTAGFDFHSVREYEQGESLRRVHWPSSARRGQLMVKELEDTTQDSVVVLLDCDARDVVGEPPESSFDVAVRVAGSLLASYARRGRVATLVATGRTRAVVAVRGGRSDLDGAVSALAAAEPDALDGLARFLAGDHSWAGCGELVVVTATTDPGAFAAILAHGARRAVSVAWIDAASFASRATRAEPGMLRLAAHGLPAAVVRRGDDLAAVLSAREVQVAARG